MREFVLDEISGVDRPAQEPALVTLIKRVDNAREQLNQLRATSSRTVTAKTVRKTPVHKEDTTMHSGPASFEDAVDSIRKADPRLSRTQAMSTAYDRHPDLVATYQSAGAVDTTKAREPQSDENESEFNTRVDGVMARDRCSRVAAMRRVASEDPSLVERYRRA